MVLTKLQIAALVEAMRADGVPYHHKHSRRVIRRLADLDIIEGGPPYRISMLGLVALRRSREKRWVDRGCMAYLDDMREVDQVIANRTHGPVLV